MRRYILVDNACAKSIEWQSSVPRLRFMKIELISLIALSAAVLTPTLCEASVEKNARFAGAEGKALHLSQGKDKDELINDTSHGSVKLPDIGADVNMADEQGITTLYSAASGGHAEDVRTLLATPGIDVNKADIWGQTPLHRAAMNGHTEIVRMLLAAPGIDIEKACQVRQMNLLQFAALAGLTDMVQQEFRNGTDVNKADKWGRTPLCGAAMNGHAEVVRLLLAAPGIDMEKACHVGQMSRLQFAAVAGLSDMVQQELRNGADINKANQWGQTPLCNAAFRGHAEVVRLLLAAPGIDVNKADQWGLTPLGYAAEKGHSEIMRMLRAAGAK